MAWEEVKTKLVEKDRYRKKENAVIIIKVVSFRSIV